jgi:hypothetical protein
MGSPGCVLLAAIFLVSAASCLGQEVASIDLTQASPHKELRRPDLKEGESPDLRSGVHQAYECDGSRRVPGVLKTTLVSLDQSRYKIGDKPRFEVRVENAGQQPVAIPSLRDLAELQPVDPAKEFGYYKMTLTLWLGGKHWESNMGGSVTLYGDKNQSMVTLQPGQWPTITGSGDILRPADGPSVSNDEIERIDARTLIYRDETLVRSNAVATVSRGYCIEQTQGPALPIQIVD